MKAIFAALLGAFFVVAIAAHVPAGRRALAAVGLSRATACPVGGRATLPLRRVALPRGEAPSRSREVAGFTLGVTTRAEVEARGLPCTAGPRRLDCARVSDVDGAPAEALWLAFDEREVLVSVVIVRREGDARLATERFETGVRTLASRTGGTPIRSGAGLNGPLSQLAAELRLHDQHASIRATNVGGSFVITEEQHAL